MSRKPVLIVLSHLRWDFVFQRPQHLLTRAAADYDVFFIEEPVFEGSAAGVRELPRGPGLTVIQPLLPPGTPPGEALIHQGDVAEAIAARAGGRPLYLWYYSPMALGFGHRIAADLVIFDKMDELGAFAFAPPGLSGFETALLETADLVFTGGASLQAATIGRRPDAHCFPSSIDMVHFRTARGPRQPEPPELAGIPAPRIGFFGVIDERMDLALVAEVAALRPDWQLVMIGPIAKIDPGTLPQAANIHWLGQQDYKDLPRHLAHWDLAWMPFALNESTRYISPTKTPEFLAAGLPVVSTPIHDVVEPYGRRGLVGIAMDAPAVVAAIARRLDEDPAARAARRTAADAHLAGSSWDRTWAAMQQLIIAAAARPAAAQPQEAARV